MSHVILQETLHGTHILLLELESHLLPKMPHIQDMLFIYKLLQQKMLALTQIKLLRLMNHVILLVTLLGTLTLLLELESQLMPKHHHIQDTPSISKLHQLKMLVLTQIKLLKLMSHAIPPEIQPGTLIPPQELVSQLMLKHHHTQDMLYISKLTHLKTIA